MVNCNFLRIRNDTARCLNCNSNKKKLCALSVLMCVTFFIPYISSCFVHSGVSIFARSPLFFLSRLLLLLYPFMKNLHVFSIRLNFSFMVPFESLNNCNLPATHHQVQNTFIFFFTLSLKWAIFLKKTMYKVQAVN